MELLAPAGDILSLKAAVNNAADAVYFGTKNFNARNSAAENFCDIKEAVRYCHLFGVKAYLALNVSIKESELTSVKETIRNAAEAGIDAFIITDISLLSYIKNSYKDIEVHASTQMGIHNRYGAILMEKMGFDRIILSRECNIDDIIDIKKHVSIPIEVFVQGALCTGFSGACLFSSVLTGESGNRGRCLQLCRRYFSAYRNGNKVNEGYLLSSKDLCYINELNELKNAGVDSLKIEGRSRRREYMSATVSQYRAALDGKNYDINLLKKLFNRGEYAQSATENSIYPFAPTHIGVEAGIVINSRGKILIRLYEEPNKDDGYKILRNNIEIGGFKGSQLKQNSNYYSLTGGPELYEGDKIHITTDAKLNNLLSEVEKRLDISIHFTSDQEKAVLSAKCNDIEVEVSENLDDNLKPLPEDTIFKQLSKLGSTNFRLNDISVNSAVSLSISSLNGMRRKAVELMEEAILAAYKRSSSRPLGNIENEFVFSPVEGDIAVVDCVKDALTAIACGIKNIVYSPSDLTYESCLAFINGLKSGCDKKEIRALLKLPIYCETAALSAIERMIPLLSGVICNNYYGIYLADKYKVMCVADINIMNDAVIWNKLSGFINSSELKASELNDKGYLFAYGFLPLMYFKHCPNKVCGFNCNDCTGSIVYKDEKGYYYIKRYTIEGKFCLNVMYNGIISDVGEFAYGKRRYFDFSVRTDESDRHKSKNSRYETKNITANTQKIKEVITEYTNGKRHRKGQFTNNHLSRGIK